VPKPLVIIVSGPPCTGKTDLGRRIAGTFSLPFVGKDGIKETLFDSLGWKDRAWSKKLSAVSYDLLYYFIESQLAAGQSFVVEANFATAPHAERFLSLKQTYPFEPLQIQCVAEGQVLLERFKRRAASGLRHPGHVDDLALDELYPILLKGKLDPLEIGGTLYEVDTTHFEAIDYDSLFGMVRQTLRNQ
jgi:predicted kinase